ncbi:MAG: MFS transporter [Actinomycetia bacterium]|nr:MFS transporter [Actinomycetes bacterium]
MPDGRPAARLVPAARALLFAYTSAMAAVAVATVFLNLFLFTLVGSIGALLAFNIGYYAVLTFVFYAAAWLFRGRSPLVPFRWGLALTAAFFAGLWAVGPRAGALAGPVGGLFAVAQGVFWFGVNLMSFDAVPAEARLVFFGSSTAINSVTGVLGPLGGAALVGWLGGVRGDLVLFGLAGVFFALALVVSVRVPPGPPMHIGRLSEGHRVVADRLLWRKTVHTLLIRGSREGVSGLVGVYLVYLATGQSWTIGVYAALTAAMRVLGSVWVAGRVRPENRWRALGWGTAGMIGGAVLLLAWRSWPCVFLYGVLTGLTLPFYSVPNAALPLDVMDQDGRIAERRVGYILSREWALNAGRLASLVLLALLAPRWGGAPALVAVLAATSVAQIGLVALARAIWPAVGVVARAP